MEQQEFDEADEILRRFVPVLPEDPAAALSPASAEPAASTPALYWCNGTLYQKRSFVIAEAPDLVQLQVRDFYLNAGARLGSGFRAWDASVLLARWVYQHAALIKDKVVLEVGAGGSGLPGLVASLFASRTYLTDAPGPLLQELSYNLDLNRPTLGPAALSRCHVSALDWAREGGGEGCSVPGGGVDVVLGAEVVYDGMDPRALAGTMHHYLRRAAGGGAAAYLAVTTEGRGEASRRQLLSCLAEQGWAVEQASLGGADDVLLLSIRRAAAVEAAGPPEGGDRALTAGE